MGIISYNIIRTPIKPNRISWNVKCFFIFSFCSPHFFQLFLAACWPLCFPLNSRWVEEIQDQKDDEKRKQEEPNLKTKLACFSDVKKNQNMKRGCSPPKFNSSSLKNAGFCEETIRLPIADRLWSTWCFPGVSLGGLPKILGGCQWI